MSQVVALFLAVLLLLPACQSYREGRPTGRKEYRRVRVTDPRGHLIADWIAEGGVYRTERGYRFRAVQRTSGEPYSLTLRYPYGRVLEIAGPNILVTPAGKPEWLYAMDGR